MRVYMYNGGRWGANGGKGWSMVADVGLWVGGQCLLAEKAGYTAWGM